MSTDLVAYGLTESRFRQVALDTDRDAARLGVAIHDRYHDFRVIRSAFGGCADDSQGGVGGGDQVSGNSACVIEVQRHSLPLQYRGPRNLISGATSAPLLKFYNFSAETDLYPLNSLGTVCQFRAPRRRRG